MDILQVAETERRLGKHLYGQIETGGRATRRITRRNDVAADPANNETDGRELPLGASGDPRWNEFARRGRDISFRIGPFDVAASARPRSELARLIGSLVQPVPSTM